jgi:hypothetical protein
MWKPAMRRAGAEHCRLIRSFAGLDGRDEGQDEVGQRLLPPALLDSWMVPAVEVQQPHCTVALLIPSDPWVRIHDSTY